MVVEMSSGCLCCTIRGDLVDTLRDALWRFARGGKTWFYRVVIETTGLADPAPILHTLMAAPAITAHYQLEGVITAVDAINGMDTPVSYTHLDVYKRQVFRCADARRSARRQFYRPVPVQRARAGGSHVEK